MILSSLNTFIIAAISALVCLLQFVPVVEAGSFPRVRIFNPRNTSTWFTGETRNIVWQLAYVPPPPDPPTLNITLRRFSDPTFRYPITTFFPTANLSFPWKLPEDLPSYSDYQIRIIPNRAFPAPGRPNIMGSKSRPFTIIQKSANQGIQLLNPTSESVWFSGETRNILWRFPNAGPEATVEIYVEETEFGFVGKPYPFLIATVPNDPSDSNGVSSYSWVVPFRFRSSPAYKITLVGKYNDGRAPVTFTQEDTFRIVQLGDAGKGTVTLVVPTATPSP